MKIDNTDSHEKRDGGLLYSDSFDEEDPNLDEDDDEDAIDDETMNTFLEAIARRIEIITGDEKAAQIVRDSKIPVGEIHYDRKVE